MGRLVQALKVLAGRAEVKTADLSMLRLLPSAAGVVVTEEKALASAAVFAAVNLLSSTVAMLPLHVVRTGTDGTRQRDPGHPVDRLIRRTPNVRQTPFEFHQFLMVQGLVWGTAYAEKIKGPRGISQLIPLASRTVVPKVRPDYTLEFDIVDFQGRERRLTQDQVLRFHGLSVDGIAGAFPIKLAREAIGLALQAERYAARLFKNDARPGGVVETDAVLSEEALTRITESWRATYAGADNAHKVAVLEAGLKWKAIAPTNKDSQFIEARKFQVLDVARYFGVPPHKIGDLERATFSNIEQMAIEFVQYSMQPWLVRIEQAIGRDLLGGSDRLAAKFSVEGLLRGDSAARAAFYASGIQHGWLTRNEARELEDRDALPGLDEPLEPLNMGRAGDGGNAA